MMYQMIGCASDHGRGYLRSTLQGLLICWMLAGCTHSQPASFESATATSKASAAPAATTLTPAAAVQAYLDPVTGQWREPTVTELAAIEKARKQTASVSSQNSVTVTTLPNGVTRYDLGTRARIHETACLDAQGQLGPCTATQHLQLEQGNQTP